MIMAPGTFTSYRPISPSLFPYQEHHNFSLRQPLTPLQPLWKSTYNLPPIGTSELKFDFLEEPDLKNSSEPIENTPTKEEQAIEELKKLTPSQLHNLGKKLDKTEFFQALLPAALESQKLYGVPAEVTLVQAAIESDWGRKGIAGYNIFGIKGSGTAGTVESNTTEYIDGKPVKMKLGFARYNNYYEAVSAHGKLFHNRYFKQITEDYIADGDKQRFITRMAKRYATAPNYAWAINHRIKYYDLENLIQQFNQKNQAETTKI